MWGEERGVQFNVLRSRIMREVVNRLSDVSIRTGVTLFALLYLSFFLLVGLDTMDSFYWMFRHSLEGLDGFFILSQMLYDCLAFLKLNSYRAYFGFVLVIWIFQFYVCSREDALVSGFLFLISLYWFKGILSPDCFSILGVLALVSYVHWNDNPRFPNILGIVVITTLLKITSIALLVPVLIWWFWGKPKLLMRVSVFSLCGLLALYVLSPTAQEHVSLDTVFNQYLVQGLVLLFAGLFVYWLLSSKLSWFWANVVLMLSVGLCAWFMEHRLLFSIVMGFVLGAFLLFNRGGRKNGFWRKMVFVALVVLMNFLGSDTGFYKSSMLLPLLTLVGVSCDNRLKLTTFLMCMSLPLLLLKPIRFNPGAYEIGAVMIKSIWVADLRNNYEWMVVDGHGGYLVMSWFKQTVDRADILVDSLGVDNISFKGPHSTFFNGRYGRPIHPSYQGPLEGDLTTVFVFGRGISETDYRVVEEVHPGFSLYKFRGAGYP